MKTKSTEALISTEFDQRMNEHKLNELYVEYKKKVYPLALSYVKDHYLAEDLSHEILVKCYLNRQKFKGECSFHSWMYRIAINHCIDFLRKSNRRGDLLHEDIEVFHDVERCTPESEVLTLCGQEELRIKLKQLPPKYAEVISLYYFKDQSLKEIEHQLNIKLSTIKTRLFRGKQKLRKMYLYG